MASRSQTELAALGQNQDLGELLNELANKMERLKTLYEQYFMGIEKMEPQVARKEVTRVMLTLQQQYIRNTALRFRFNTMLQKWNIYITYWNRVLREIENGTYVRHLAKAKRKAESEGRELPSEMQSKKVRPASGTFETEPPSAKVQPPLHDIDTGSHPIPPPPKTDPEIEQVFDRAWGEALLPKAPPRAPAAPNVPAAARTLAAPTPPPANARPLAPPLPPPLPPPAPSAQQARDKSPAPLKPLPNSPSGPLNVRRPPPPGPPPPSAPRPPAPPPSALLPKIPGMAEPELRALHQRYVDAQKKSGAPSTVKYEVLVSSLAKQVPNVLKQPGVKGVRFDVSVQDGKPVLKAIPQK